MSGAQDLAVAQGPFLAIAAFFETVIREDTGVLTLVRMIDKFTISTPHTWITGLPRSPVSAALVVSFRGQRLEGPGVVSIRPKKPSGEDMPSRDIPFVFDGEAGVNLNIQLGMMADEEGYYWFDIFLNEEFITRVPLQIEFRQATEAEGEGPEGPEGSPN